MEERKKLRDRKTGRASLSTRILLLFPSFFNLVAHYFTRFRIEIQRNFNYFVSKRDNSNVKFEPFFVVARDSRKIS